MKPMTTSQAFALLKIAEQCMLPDLPTSRGMILPSPAADVWLELGRCMIDLVGAATPDVSPSARAAVIRRGYAREPVSVAGNNYARFRLTEQGHAWCAELAAVSRLVRGLRRLDFDL